MCLYGLELIIGRTDTDMNEHANMLKTVMQNLEHELPDVNSSTVQQIARMILGEKIEQSMGSLAVSLLQSDVSVGHVLSAMLRCEWLAAQHLIESSDPNDIKNQVHIFAESVEQFNILQAAIIDAADQRWQGSLDGEVKQRVLAELKLHWKETGLVHLHNYFDEIPVSARVEFKDFDKGYLRVSTSANLTAVFAASRGLRSAMISSLDRKHSLIVSGVSKHEGVILLEISGAEVSLRERRKDVRVKLANSLPVSLNHRGKMIHALIDDISCTGIGVTLLDGGDAALQHNEKVNVAFKLGSEVIKGNEAEVCWSRKIGSDCRVGIMFKPLTIKREVVYRFIFVQEQAIIGRLRKLDTPSWMKDSIKLCDENE